MYITPSDQMTLTEKERRRKAAWDAGLERARARLNLTPAQLIGRHAQNIADFGTVGRETWLTQTLLVVNTPYSVWTTLAAPAVGLTPALPNNRVAVFYSAKVLTAPNPVSLLSFRLGAAGGYTKAVFDLEQIEGQLVEEGYFTLPISYDPLDVLNVAVTCKIATLAQAAVVLGCFVFEPTNITQSSQS